MVTMTRILSKPVTKKVKFEVLGNAGVITLNRPKMLNTLNEAMIDSIRNKLGEWLKPNSRVKHVIQKGTGKAFCAGGDVKAMVNEAQAGNHEYAKRFMWKEYRLNYAINSYPLPFISVLDGYTMGGGCGISSHGKYRVSTENTDWAMPEVDIGFFPDHGASHFLNKLKHHEFGTYLAMTGARLKGNDVYLSGASTSVCASYKVQHLLDDLTNSNSAEEVECVLQHYNDTAGENNNVFKQPFSYDKEKLRIIHDCFGQDTLHEMFGALEKEAGLAGKHRDWVQKVLDNLNAKATSSLSITMEQMRRGEELSLEEAFQMEWGIGCQAMHEKDFYEGVRAKLQEKDNKPIWDENWDQDTSRYFTFKHDTTHNVWTPQRWNYTKQT